MYRLLVGAGVIVVIIFLMAFSVTYMQAHLVTDLNNSIDTSTDMGYRANQTMLNFSRSYDTSVNMLAAVGWIMVITMPLAAIVILKKVF